MQLQTINLFTFIRMVIGGVGLFQPIHRAITDHYNESGNNIIHTKCTNFNNDASKVTRHSEIILKKIKKKKSRIK